mgnify:FL=1
MSKIEIPKQNIIDRTIAYFNPLSGLKRLEARTRLAMLGGYTGARTGRRQTKTWNAPSGSADSVSINDLPLLRDRSRDLLRNAPLATGAVHTVVTNVIGTGLKVQSHIDRDILRPYLKNETVMEQFEKEAERIFRIWSENSDCDITRTQTFSDMQSLILRSCLESGDVFIARRYKERPGNPFGTTLQIIEADRIASDDVFIHSNVVAGIELDKEGAPIAYHILNRNPHDTDDETLKSIRVPAYDTDGRRQILHIFNRNRVALFS